MARLKQNSKIREELLNQGLQLLIKQGYHGTGIKELVDQVKVPKGSFYNYFESKEHFGAEVIRHYSQQITALMRVHLNSPENDVLTALKNFFEQEMQRHQEVKAGCILGNLGAELGASSELCQQAMLEGFQDMKQLFSQTFERGQAQKTIRDDISAAELADFVINAYEGALLRMQVSQSVEPIRQLSTLMTVYLKHP
ncbi:MAG: TetR family transcriptional regulator C-terminal domain-containing protein [Cyanobacteria bacterium P01_E01_bin.6]